MSHGEEGYLPVPGGRVWYRSLGEGDVPLLCLHGGPGFTHNYMEVLGRLADERRVIFYDQLGCGNSERPDDISLWTVERFVDELAVVRDALGLDRVHLLGSSWGGMLALQYVLDRGPAPDSLVLVGSPASMPRWSRECAELLAGQPAEVQRTIREHENSGCTACPEYQAAILGFYREHVCRMRPWPAGLERSFAGLGEQVYHTMNGPSEFTVTGTLKDWDVTERLGEITVPTLLIGGRHDECRPAHLEDMHRRIPGSRLAIIEDASHLCFAEQWDAFRAELVDFLGPLDEG
ncbi:proline iminopeptidase-family hydrolase [Nocardia sp. CDC159]|uniref:Proline iminopeptidase n=1 Tax=Nocardia pulmonis TaxID=2951408 RepID=A0A9X2IY42_9NOCA|nr:MULTISPECIES: proline iminopeptidase-family hydrolase [Nocardia]MCM6775299.1 proline iminopeptidase-family hydrolase [Nocardia pulmonis]MCM6787967.1 proline iminopeptidase-family hydrolase [Nocardia sp. CDC159]